MLANPSSEHEEVTYQNFSEIPVMEKRMNRRPKIWDEDFVQARIIEAKGLIPDAIQLISEHEKGLSILQEEDFASNMDKIQVFVRKTQSIEYSFDELSLLFHIRKALGK